MPDLNLDFGDGTVQTTGNGGGSNGGTQDITGGTAKDNGTDITNKDNNNNGNNGGDNGNGNAGNNNGSNANDNTAGGNMVMVITIMEMEIPQTLLRGGSNQVLL